MRSALPTVLAVSLMGGASLGLYVHGVDRRPQLSAPDRSAPHNLVALDEPDGRQLLYRSDARESFLPLAAHFETQQTPTFCGIASLAMVLNALRVPAPATGTRPYFTQDNVLNGLTADVVREAAVRKHGMSIRQFAEVLRVYGIDAELRLASESSLEDFRNAAAASLRLRDHVVVVNYARSALGQDGRGHISPLAAYDAQTDRFLVLDVSRDRYPPVWVAASELFDAMAQIASFGSTRGYVVARRRG